MSIGRVVSRGLNYAWRGVKVYPHVVFGTGQEAMGAAYKAAMVTRNPLKSGFWKGLWQGTKDAGKVAEGIAAKSATTGGFLKNFFRDIKGIPRTLGRSWKAGGLKAARSGKNVFLGKLGGLFGGIGKKMPVIGSLLMIACELPNIFKATKEQGFMAGLKETGKAGARLGGATLLGAIGTAIGGPIGGIVGFMVGDWLAGKIVGKSYSEKVAEQEQAIADAGGVIPQGPYGMPQDAYVPQGVPAGSGYASVPQGFDTQALSPSQMQMLYAQLYGSPNNLFDCAYPTMNYTV